MSPCISHWLCEITYYNLLQFLALTICLYKHTPMIPKVLPVDLVRFYLVERAIEGANKGAVILYGKGPAIEEGKTIGAQAQDVTGRVRSVMGASERPDMCCLRMCAAGQFKPC